jgi:NADPH:quinone reductase-like Zn-dependent oxidoreductase
MIGDVLVKVAAVGITHNELDWPLRTCRNGHPRDSIIPGQEVSGVVAAVGMGTAGIAVGGEVLARSSALLKPGGTLVSVVSWELPADRDDIKKVFFIQEAKQVQLTELARLVDEGHLRPQVGGVYPLAQAAEAYRAKAAGGIPGRMVLQPWSSPVVSPWTWRRRGTRG